MVAAGRNYAGHDSADQIKKAGLPASTIVAQSVCRHRALRLAVEALRQGPRPCVNERRRAKLSP